MKRFLLAISVFATALGAADLHKVKNVYLLPMGQGLDQYLAGRLTAEGVFQVVADPKKADAVLTDQIGPGFESKLTELRAEPVKKPEKTDKPEAAKTEKGDVSAADTSNKMDAASTMSSWGRGKGNVFLVDATTREVIWSVWEKPKGTNPEQLDRTATGIVGHLKRDLNGGETKPKKAAKK